MFIVNSEEIVGKEIDVSLGLVRGSATRSRSIVSDFVASLKNIIGGEVHEYTKLLADTREQAFSRMVKDAEKMEADAIVNVRITTSTISQGTSEILAYGTAVKLK
jgi:uncharacterized protein YbjQ (UPF0145 family)